MVEFLGIKLLTRSNKFILKLGKQRLTFPYFKAFFFSLFLSGELMWTIVDREWRYGDTMCKLFKFFQTFGLTSSTYLVVAIGLDRLWAIVTPLSRSEAQLLSLVSCLSTHIAVGSFCG